MARYQIDANPAERPVQLRDARPGIQAGAEDAQPIGDLLFEIERRADRARLGTRKFGHIVARAGRRGLDEVRSFGGADEPCRNGQADLRRQQLSSARIVHRRLHRRARLRAGIERSAVEHGVAVVDGRVIVGDVPGLGIHDRVGAAEFQRRGEIAAAPGTARVEADAGIVRPRAGPTVRRRDGRADIVALQDEIDHAAHRIGAIDRRLAAGTDLDTLDCAQRDAVEVDEALFETRRARDAPAVDQHQRIAGAQSTQVRRRYAERADIGHDAGAAVAGVRIQRAAAAVVGDRADRRDVLRQGADQFLDGGHAAIADFLGVDDDQAAGLVAVAQAAAGDEDVVGALRLLDDGILKPAQFGFRGACVGIPLACRGCIFLLEIPACLGLFGRVAVGGYGDVAFQRFLLVGRLLRGDGRPGRLSLLRRCSLRGGKGGDDRTGAQQGRLLHDCIPL